MLSTPQDRWGRSVGLVGAAVTGATLLVLAVVAGWTGWGLWAAAVGLLVASAAGTAAAMRRR